MKRQQLLRKTPLKRGTKGLKRTRLSPVSAKRWKDMKNYAELREELLERIPTCEICRTRKSTDCHHRKGRSGKNYLDATGFMALCRSCHDWLHRNPSQARSMGLLTSSPPQH